MTDHDFNFLQCCYRFLTNLHILAFPLLFKTSSASFLSANWRFLLFYLVCGINHVLVDWYSFFIYIYIYLSHCIHHFVIFWVILWIRYKPVYNIVQVYAGDILYSMWINCSFILFAFDFRRLDVFSARTNLVLMILFPFRRSWNLFVATHLFSRYFILQQCNTFHNLLTIHFL